MRLQLKIKTHFIIEILCLSIHSHPPRDLWKGVNASSDVTMYASMQVEDILSICYEIDWISSKKATFVKLVACI